LNLDKTNIIKFTTINLPQCPLSIGYNDKYIEVSVHTKFLGLHIDSHLNWKTHIDQLIPKLSAGLLCSKIVVTYQQHWYAQINLLCLFSLLNEVWNM
jgi:hypothetical protein